MKIGRNDPCPCGSGKKYKKCCIDKCVRDVSDVHTAPIENSVSGFDYILINKKSKFLLQELLYTINVT